MSEATEEIILFTFLCSLIVGYIVFIVRDYYRHMYTDDDDKYFQSDQLTNSTRYSSKLPPKDTRPPGYGKKVQFDIEYHDEESPSPLNNHININNKLLGSDL